MNQLKKHEHRIIIRITGHDSPIYFSDFEMHQEMLQHTVFRFLWHITDDFRTCSAQALENFREFLNTEIIFCFYTSTEKPVYYKGIVTGMKMENTDGATVGYRITGKSPTIMMDDFPHNRVHLQKTLSQIIKDTFYTQIMGLWNLNDIKPRYKEIICCSMQSDESDWNYVTRLAKQYGEWLYYDGERIAFSPRESGMVFKNGNNLQKFAMEVVLSSNKSALSGYDYRSAQQIQSEQEHIEGVFSDDLINNAIKKQYNQYTKRLKESPYSTYNPAAQDQKTIERMRHLDTSVKASRMVIYTGTTREPVNTGSIITIEDQGVRHTVIITQCTFQSVGTGNLTSSFSPIPVDCDFPPYTDPLARGFAYGQPAVVIDNNDPEGMGRVRVRYFWNQKTSENETDWIRIQTPYAGNDKGFYWIPETGEEVHVAFDGNHPEAPYVSGALYNGKQKSGYATAGNDMKVLQSRSGIKIEYNDAEGSLTLEDTGGTIFFMDGKGNMTVTAPNNITFNVGNDFKINVANNAVIDIKRSLEIIAGQIKESVENSKESTVKGNLTETTGTTQHISKGDITFRSAATAEFFGIIDTKVNKG